MHKHQKSNRTTVYKHFFKWNHVYHWLNISQMRFKPQIYLSIARIKFPNIGRSYFTSCQQLLCACCPGLWRPKQPLGEELSLLLSVQPSQL